MRLGLYAHTHGVSYPDAQNKFVKSIPATSMRPLEVTQAGRAGGLSIDVVPRPAAAVMRSRDANKVQMAAAPPLRHHFS
jgi:hypothetical protein